MKKEILKLLASNPKDYHGKARYLYWLVFISILIAQYKMIWFLGDRLSHGMFLVIVALYMSVLLLLGLLGRREKLKVEKLQLNQ